MAAKQQSIELPTVQFRGLDLRSSLTTKNFNSAVRCSNVVKDPSGKILVRPGSMPAARLGEYGEVLFSPVTYTYFDQTTGTVKEQLMALGFFIDGVTLYKLTETSFRATSSFPGPSTISLTPADYSTISGNINKWRLVITENVTVVLDNLYANCYEQSTTPKSIQDIRDDIDALAHWSCSSLPVADLEHMIDVLGPSFSASVGALGHADFPYYGITQVGTLDNSPNAVFDAAFELPSFLNYGNLLYIAYGSNLYVYDGVSVKRAGLPIATINAIADAAAGATFPNGSVYIYKLVYSRIDAVGNIIEGEDSDDSLPVATHTMSATKNIDLTVNNLTPSVYPNFNVLGAKVNGAQAAVNTITVDAAHTLVAGETAYLFDGVTSSYVQRLITAVGATSITIDGNPVNVLDNAIISNNVRIQIWRTTNGGTEFQLVDEIPNDALNATQVFTDTIADASLGEPFTEQLRKHSLPPKCTYVGEHQGLVVLAGDPENPVRVSWSLPTDIQAFPLESNNLDLRSAGVGKVTGFGSLDINTLAVFKKTSHAKVVGSLDDLILQTIDRKDTGIGCTSFRTITTIGDDSHLIGLSLRGPFMEVEGELQLALSEGIEPFFVGQDYTQEDGVEIDGTDVGGSKLVFSRAVAINDYIDKKYHLYVPADVGTPGSDKRPSRGYSRWIILDYRTDPFYWTTRTVNDRYNSNGYVVEEDVNAQAGFAIYQNTLFWGSMFRVATGQVSGQIWKQLSPDTKDNYIDSTHPINVDLIYTPVIREIGAVTAFFKPLFLTLNRFFDAAVNYDIPGYLDYEDQVNFGVRVGYLFNNLYERFKDRTFKVANGQNTMRTKCTREKCRMFQIKISTPNAARYEIFSIDNVELVYSTPYDRQSKEPRK